MIGGVALISLQMTTIRKTIERAMRIASSTANTETSTRINEIVNDAVASASSVLLQQYGAFIIKKFSTEPVLDKYAEYYSQYLLDEFLKTLSDED
jgi:hypothetical protein